MANQSHLSPNAPPKPHHNHHSGARKDFYKHVNGSSVMMQPATHEQDRAPRKLILCFDGTGNKFRGDDSDSNILKIFRCLDREAGDQYHYYQPGIGTYVVSSSLSHTGVVERFKSWYLKAKDSAVGSSFDQHVVGGYRFLMRFYNPGDEIYFFGFSRGAYVARFLAEMLDYVGLLSHGNEEMVHFAWKAFSQWQGRKSDDSPESVEKRREMYRFMKGFRETFSRPVKRIRFLGLFDTVNSVPRFETAWMQRSKFPYTARSSAKVIRHCVSIDERRAKFRQDLIYQGAGGKKKEDEHHHLHIPEFLHEKYRARRRAAAKAQQPNGPATNTNRGRKVEEHAFRPHSRSRSRATTRDSSRDRSNGASPTPNGGSGTELYHEDDSDSDDDEQDIDEIWFAGGHGDVGGGWEFTEESKSTSHLPLAYMIREAARAGLEFDPVTLVDLGLSHELEWDEEDEEDDEETGLDDADDEKKNMTNGDTNNHVPNIRIDVSSPSPPFEKSEAAATGGGAATTNGNEKNSQQQQTRQQKKASKHQESFRLLLEKAHTARIHDSLEFSSGLGKGQVLSWKFMEYMPFRRMDLKGDGSWEPIRWPLPCGETRDIPSNARVHGSVIARMRKDGKYRPGNLIVGGGGRGCRYAPEEHGIGEWECVQEKGDPIGEVWVKRSAYEKREPEGQGVE